MPPKVDNEITGPTQLLQEFGGIHGQIRKEHGGAPFLMRHNNFALQDLSHLLPTPQRKKGEATLTDARSFIAFVNNQKDINTQIFATESALVAVINFHGAQANGAQWSDYRAKFVLTQTKEWKNWMDRNRKEFNQTEFALFLEENELLFVDPNGASLLELIQTLEGKSNAKFNSAVRLQNGKVSLAYEEDIELRGGSAGSQSGQIELPQRLKLGISPFEGCQKYAVEARLRYRIQSRQITFWYETINAHLVIKDAVQGIMNQVKDGTGIEPMLGTFASAT